MSAPTGARGQVFISYGRTDASMLAAQLKDTLTHAGFKVWVDTASLRGGKAWEEQIAEGLRKSQAVVALLSPYSTRQDSTGSGDSVCLDELALARFGQPPTPIVPVLAVTGATIPTSIFRLHYIDFANATTPEVLQLRTSELIAALDGAAAGQVRYRSWTTWLSEGPDFARFLHSKRADFVGRDWLFTQVGVWLAQRDESALLLKGDPGVGKSAIVAQMSFGRLQVPIVATYCCQFDVAETLRPATFVRTVAAQFASRLPEYGDAIEQSDVRAILENAERDPASAFDLCVLAPLARLAAPPGSAILVIDALDEALDFREGSNVVDLLTFSVERMPSWLRIIATTRRNKGVLLKLGGLRATEVEANTPDNLRDLALFVAHRRQAPAIQSALVTAGVDPLTFERSVIQQSAGSFLYADLVFRGITRGRVRPEDLENLPPGLDAKYASDLKRAFPSATAKAAVLPIFQVLCAALEPIPEHLAAAAVGMTEREFARTIAPLEPFLKENQGPHRFVAFWHKSFHDFLTDIDNADTEFAVDPTQGDRRLAELYTAIVDAEDDLAVAVRKVPEYLYRHGLEHLGLGGTFFEGLSAEQVHSIVYCGTWSNGRIAVGAVPTLAPALVSRIAATKRFAEAQLLLEALHQAAIRHYGQAGLLQATQRPDGKTGLAVTGRATEAQPLARALITTGHMVFVVDRLRALGCEDGTINELLETLEGPRHLVAGLSQGAWSRDLHSGWFDDQAYALDIMIANLRKGKRASDW